MSSGSAGVPVVNPPTNPTPLVTPVAPGSAAAAAALFGWVEFRQMFVPISAYPSPTHLSAGIMEFSAPQEFVTSSHPAAGSTASVTITNPGTNNSRAIVITGYLFALAQGTASAGQINNGTITGSIGGQYTGEAVVIGVGANTVDRYAMTGRTFVSGNATIGNITENLTLAFGLAGIANLFQQVTVWFRYAV